MWTADGRALTGVYGAGPGPATGGVDLKSSWSAPDSTMTWHVEGHAAAIMRRDEIKDTVLYLNTRPCKKPQGCHDTISDVLPIGYTLTVFYSAGKGSIAREIYPGNGKGLKAYGE